MWIGVVLCGFGIAAAGCWPILAEGMALGESVALSLTALMQLATPSQKQVAFRRLFPSTQDTAQHPVVTLSGLEGISRRITRRATGADRNTPLLSLSPSLPVYDDSCVAIEADSTDPLHSLPTFLKSQQRATPTPFAAAYRNYLNAQDNNGVSLPFLYHARRMGGYDPVFASTQLTLPRPPPRPDARISPLFEDSEVDPHETRTFALTDVILNDDLGLDTTRKRDSLNQVPKPDTAKVLMTALDSLAAIPVDSTARLSQFKYRRPETELFPVLDPRIYPLFVPRVTVNRATELDSTGQFITITEKIGTIDLRTPITVPFAVYDSIRLQQAIRNNFRELIGSRSRRQQRDALSDVFNKITRISIYVPGGESSIFSTLFGPPTVSVQVAGNVDIRAGVQIEDSEDPIRIAAGTARRRDPSFDQQVQLNLAGSIGDKLLLSADWNTQRPFEFENQIKIRYRGYEDDIVQSIEAGNVSLSIPTSLIGSNQALFGIKSQFQFAGLSLQTILTQQRGRSDVIPIRGGGQQLPINLFVSDYDYQRHFFLTRFHSTSWDTAFAIAINNNRSDVPAIITDFQGRQLIRVEVWISQLQGMELIPDRRSAVALFNYGDENYDFQKSFGEDRYAFPDSLYRGALPPEFTGRPNDYLDYLRNTQTNPVIVTGEGVSAEFQLLREGVDYDLDRTLGYISLRRSIVEGDIVGVAMEFGSTTPGVAPIRIGNFFDDPRRPRRLLLKMIKPSQLNSRDTAGWAMMLKNIYSLGTRDIQREGFDLRLVYTDQGSNPPDRETLPLPGNPGNLLTLTRLDNFNAAGVRAPDQEFDFIPLVLDTRRGLLIFPFVKPFETPIRRELNRLGITDPEERNRFIFREIYTAEQATARQQNGAKQYSIRGSIKGATQSVFQLGFNVVEGSVRVISNGRVLTENVDFRVDYQLGQVEIIRQDLLSSGANLEVSYEKNDLALLAARNMIGARAEYVFSDRFKIGGTFLQYSERPLADKVRIGDEPILNSIYGFDTEFTFRSLWLTRLIDAIPFLSTKEESEFSLRAEFAQILPSAPRELFTPLDPEGVSFIDDFDATKQIITLGLDGNQWSLASPPSTNPTPTLREDSLTSNRRALTSWYRLPPGSGDRRNVRTSIIFPNRFAAREDQIVRPLNIDFYPNRRGPYNFSPDYFVRRTVEPDSMWGGFMRFFPPFMQNLQNPPRNNIEFMELWIKLDSIGNNVIPDSGKLYIELGSINEDVIPNNQLNIEDGMPISDIPGQDDDPASVGRDSYGRFLRATGAALTARINGVININPFDGRTEDLGLDGLSSDEERIVHATYLAQAAEILGSESPEYRALVNDPSGDDYSGVGTVLDRVSGTEGNAALEAGAFGNRFPDRESLDNNPNVDRANSYYRYTISLRQEELARDIPQGEFVVGGGRTNGGWVQMRIPLRSFSETIGNISGFQNIRYGRIWVNGFRSPVRVQLAALDFVGSQWQSLKGTDITQADTSVSISAINLEENAAFYASPSGITRARNRQRVDQDIRANEQSLVVTAFTVPADSFRAAFRDFQPANVPGSGAGLNLNPYQFLRAFVHGGRGIRYNPANPQDPENTQAFLRFGNDLSNNFYEIRFPVIPTPDVRVPILRPGQNPTPDYIRAQDSLWLRENEINVDIQEIASFVLLQQQGITEKSHPLPNNRTLIVRGRPTMGNVRFFMFGIRNPSPFALDTAEVWLNELRVSGFNQEKGWAVRANATLKLADFMNITAAVSRQTADFHQIDVRINQLSAQNNTLSYALGSTIRLDKFLPTEDGWSLPVAYEYSRTIIDPRFSPSQTDISLDVFIERLVADTLAKGASEAEALAYGEFLRFRSQSSTETRRISIPNIGKNRPSDFWLSAMTIDRIKLNYNFTITNSRSPQEIFREDWNWIAGIDYTYQFPQDWYFEPFRFFAGLPLLDTYKNLRFYYFPQVFAISGNFNRQRRQFQLVGSDIPPPFSMMTGTRTMRIDYRITETLQLGFSSQLGGSLYKYVMVDSLTDRPGSDIVNLIFQDLVKLDLGRDQTYNQDVTLNWRPKMIDPLSWITLDFSYGGRYQWINPLPDATTAQGNNISSGLTFRSQTTLRTRDFFTKIGLLSSAGASSAADSVGQLEALLSLFGSVLKTAAKLEQITLNYTYNNTLQTGGILAGPGAFNFYPFNLLRNQDLPTPPSLGYQLGLAPFQGERISLGEDSRGIQFPEVTNQANNLQISTSWSPFDNLRIDLNWESSWTFSRNVLTEGRTGDIANFTVTGSQRRSFLSIGRTVDNFTALLIEPDGTIAQDNASIASAFTRGFEQGTGGLFSTLFGLSDAEATFLPLPNWRLTLTGLERIGFLSSLFSSFSLDHAYNSNYASNFQEQFQNPRQVTNITITENFAPLIGANINWNFGLNMILSYNVTRSFTLQPGNNSFEEGTRGQITVSLGFRQQGIKIPFDFWPFKGATLNNDLDVSFNFAIADDERLNYQITPETINQTPPIGTRQLTFSPRLNYALSQRVTAGFFWEFTRIEPKATGSAIFPSTRSNIGFNFRIGIGNDGGGMSDF